MLTFGEFKAGRARRIAGACSSSQLFTDLTNDATRMLMRRGMWWGTVRKLTMCVYDSCIVFPRFVLTPLAINHCGHSIVPKNQWFDFNSVLPEDVRGFNRVGVWDGNCRCGYGIESLSTTPVFSQPPCLNDRYLQFYPTRAEDVGKVITIFGTDSNGQTIRSTHADGIYQDGIELSLALPYVQTPMLVRHVDRVIKEVTDGDVYGYQFDGATRYNLAVYQPSETNPDYSQIKLHGLRCNNSNCCPTRLDVLVKLKFIPVVNDDDLILIDNEDALANMIQALNKQDAYNNGEAETYIQQAIHESNLELRSRLNLDSTPVRVEVYGTAKLCRARIGGVF